MVGHSVEQVGDGLQGAGGRRREGGAEGEALWVKVACWGRGVDAGSV